MLYYNSLLYCTAIFKYTFNDTEEKEGEKPIAAFADMIPFTGSYTAAAIPPH